MAEQALEEAGALTPSPDMDAAQIGHWLAQAQVALAGADAQEQRYAGAEARYIDVLQAHPQLLPALQGLGQLYMQLGRIDEAVGLFEQILAIDPARGHAALINARRFPQDEETLIRTENLARRHGLSGPVQHGLLLQLAAAREKRKEYARAFTPPTKPMPPTAHFYVTIRLHTDKAARVSATHSAVRSTITGATSATIQRCRYSYWVCRVPVRR